jgi:phosphoglycerate dehydrogenase-like enzyme
MALLNPKDAFSMCQGSQAKRVAGFGQVVNAVAECLERHGCPPLVVDPVLVSTSGDNLADRDTLDAFLNRQPPPHIISVHDRSLLTSVGDV